MQQQQSKGKQSSINKWLLLDITAASTLMLGEPKHKFLLDDIHRRRRRGKELWMKVCILLAIYLHVW